MQELRSMLKYRRDLEFVAGVLSILLALTVRLVYWDFKDHPFSIACTIGLFLIGARLLEDAKQLTKRIKQLG
jgi:hypothetical protein